MAARVLDLNDASSRAILLDAEGKLSIVPFHCAQHSWIHRVVVLPGLFVCRFCFHLCLRNFAHFTRVSSLTCPQSQPVELC